MDAYIAAPPGAPVAPPGKPPLPVRPRSLPERHSVRAQVLAALRDALAGGQLAPGEVYSAPALAERYGVSATPVREAMQQLASEGAVETVPNRGFRIAGHTARDAAELAEVRAALEVPAIMRLARTVPRSAGTNCARWPRRPSPPPPWATAPPTPRPTAASTARCCG